MEQVSAEANAPSYEAVRIVRDWKSQRPAGHLLIAAIRLYAAVLRGDVSVLAELFPGFALGGSVGYKPTRRAPMSAPTVVFTPPSEGGLLDVLDDNLGF